MNPRFPLLSIVSWALRIIGGIMFLIGVFSSLKQAVALADCLPNCRINYSWAMMNAAFLIPGLLSMGFGEAIGVLFAIEDNTRKMVEKKDDITTVQLPPE